MKKYLGCAVAILGLLVGISFNINYPSAVLKLSGTKLQVKNADKKGNVTSKPVDRDDGQDVYAIYGKAKKGTKVYLIADKDGNKASHTSRMDTIKVNKHGKWRVKLYATDDSKAEYFFTQNKKASHKKSKIVNANKISKKLKVIIPENTQKAKAETNTSNLSPVAKLGSKLHESNSDFSGATTYNGILTFVLKNDVANNGVAGLKAQQKNLMYGIMEEVNKYKADPLATNGILVTGAYIKDDDGYHVPTIALFFNHEILSSSSLYDQTKLTSDPTSPLFTATASYVYGQWLLATTGKGIYEDVHLVNVQNAPDWFTDVYTGEIDQLKPTTK